MRTIGPAAGRPARDDAPAGTRSTRGQVITFAIVGGANTVLGIALTTLWLTVLGDSAPAGVAVVLAYAITVVVAFGLHRMVVFRAKGQPVRDFLRFVLVNSGGLILNVTLLQLAVSVLHVPAQPAAVVVMAVVATFSFLGHRLFTFRRT
ncbi:GtrA family protein [Rhodococcus zopfii]|uniref:GtrA family protein n=1 Tax=Rhodococcus zopfii TaxID=43772 RepID=UPI0009F83375|nr:GtrA family protein [Rhodococcus zopfii]